MGLTNQLRELDCFTSARSAVSLEVNCQCQLDTSSYYSKPYSYSEGVRLLFILIRHATKRPDVRKIPTENILKLLIIIISLAILHQRSHNHKLP